MSIEIPKQRAAHRAESLSPRRPSPPPTTPPREFLRLPQEGGIPAGRRPVSPDTFLHTPISYSGMLGHLPIPPNTMANDRPVEQSLAAYRAAQERLNQAGH